MPSIIVVPHDPKWHRFFEQEAVLIHQIWDSQVDAVHHIGSTAIPGIFAKPIIDILVVVKSIAVMDGLNPAIAAVGYEPMGEYGIPGRRFFRKGDDEHRSHHIHAFQVGHPDISRHLNFRDYMRAHPEDARAYSDLKRSLALQFPHNIEGYMDGKDALIREMDRRAAEWQAKNGSISIQPEPAPFKNSGNP